MPDLTNFSIVRAGNVTVSVPKYNISCTVVNSQNGVFIRDLSVAFPACLAGLTDPELDDLFTDFITMIVQRRIERNF